MISAQWNNAYALIVYQAANKQKGMHKLYAKKNQHKEMHK